MKKKLLSILLSLAMMITMIPFATTTASAVQEITNVGDLVGATFTKETVFYNIKTGAIIQKGPWSNSLEMSRNIGSLINTDDVRSNISVTKDEDKYVAVDGKKTCTFVMKESNQLESIILKGYSKAFDGEYKESITVGDMLGIAKKEFPTQAKYGWVSEGKYCYKDENNLVFSSSEAQTTVELSKEVTRQDFGSYKFTSDSYEVTFNIDINNEVLTNIILSAKEDNYNKYNGTYIAQKNISDVLESVYFPSAEGEHESYDTVTPPGNAWRTKDGKVAFCAKIDGEEKLCFVESEDVHSEINVKEIVTEKENNYEYDSITFVNKDSLTEIIYNGGSYKRPCEVFIDTKQDINGNVSVDKNYAIEDETVTITTTPNEGYILAKDGLKATYEEDKNKKDIILIPGTTTGTYTFVMPKQKVTITAEFVEARTVTFNMNGHGDNTEEQVALNSKATEPEDPKATGYTFGGWYKDEYCTEGKEFDFENTEIIENTTLYAKWTAIEYEIEYELDGGTVEGNNPTMYTIETDNITLINPVKTGYKFDGWTGTDIEEASKSVTINRGSTGNREYVANWAKNEESVVNKRPVELVSAKATGSKKVKLSWNSIEGATEYALYGNRCGRSAKKLKTTESTSYTVKKIAGKKLAAHKSYKFYVVAKTPNGNVKSKTIHFITAKTKGKYANVKSIKTKYDEVLLGVGRTQKLGATYKMYSGKKHIPKGHGKALRFTSDCPSVATVSASGIVTAISPGTATIYIQDIGGKYCKSVIKVNAGE